MTGRLTVVPLRRDHVRARLEELIRIDELAVACRDLERWDASAWLAERDGKWELSWMALTGSQVVGYRVVSSAGRLPGFAHGHRLLVADGRRRSGIGRALMTTSHNAIRRQGFRGVTGLIEPSNIVSQEFFARHGYRPVNGRPRLWAKHFDGTDAFSGDVTFA